MKKYLQLVENKKFLLITVVSVILVVVLVTQVTTALFFGGSNASSTIVISDLNITAEFLNQQDGNLNITTQDLIPGERIPRTLQITNAPTSEDAYVRIQAIFFIDTNDNDTFEDIEESYAVQIELAEGQTGWLKGTTGPQHWFTYTSVLTAGEIITVDLNFVIYPIDGNNDYSIGNDEAGKSFKLQTKVNAVQSENNGTSYANASWPEV